MKHVFSFILLLILSVSSVTAQNTPLKVIATTTIVADVAQNVGGDLVTLTANAAATLVDGVPVPVLYFEIFSPTRYKPSALVGKPYPAKDLDFSSSGAYSVYNWELFYHVPIMIGMLGP